MASIRIIKKDIDFLISEVVSDCWGFIYIHQDKKADKAVEIMNGAIELRNDLFSRINNFDKAEAKKHFKAINQDLLKGVDGLFVKISELTK